MPRWAEIVILLVVAFMAVIAILVYARVRHRANEEHQLQIDLTLAQSHAIPDLPSGLLDVGPPPARLSTPPLSETAYAERVSIPSVNRPSASADVGTSGPDYSSDATAVLTDRPFVLTDIVPLSGEEVSTLDDVVTAEDSTGDASNDVASDVLDQATGADSGARSLALREVSVVEAGSPAELAVLRDAERALTALYAYRLRADIPKAIVQAEADRLSSLLGRLPESTRVAVEAALEGGYRRLAREGNGPLVATPGAASSRAMAVGDAEVGRGDPNDLRSFADKIRSLERGARTRPAPAAGGLEPLQQNGGIPAAPSDSAVSPPTPLGVISPSVGPSPTPSPASSLPAASPSLLDGRLD